MVKRKDVIRFFRLRGFSLEKAANHDKLVHPDGRWTVLGRHREIRNRTFEDMKKQVGLKGSDRNGKR